MKVAINSFVRRQTAESPYSHWDMTDEQLIRAVEINLDQAKPGYRDGVLVVSVPPYGFYTGLVQLQEGDTLVGSFKARREGEEPRKSVHCHRGNREKVLAKAVDVILYSHDVLAEDDDAETDAEWEIISVNARACVGEEPISPGTLMHNQFGSDGGTDTLMTESEFYQALQYSFSYWKDKALLG